MPPLSVGDIHKSLKIQAEVSQKIYQIVLELTSITEESLDNTLKRRLENLSEELIKVGDALSDSIDETSNLVLKSLEPARNVKSLEPAG